MKVRDQMYIPTYIKYIFRNTKRVFNFDMDDFSDMSKKGSFAVRSLRAIIARKLYERYQDHTLSSYFTGVSVSRLTSWSYEYHSENKKMIVQAMEKQLKLKK